MLIWRANHVLLTRCEYGSSFLSKEEPMNNITGLDPVAPLLLTVATWLEQRRLAQHAALLDSLPDYLLSDIGLSRAHDLTEAARQAQVPNALRRF